MESPRKFNDCYFYYYSTCTKGDNCVFRHEPSALGCETMCSLWQQGKCLDKRCKLRHMELRKNRKQIPCYWETQPGGCRKKHCPFMHKNPDARSDGIMPSQPGQLQAYENPQSVCSIPDTVSADGLSVPTVSAVPGVPVQGVPVPGVPGVAPVPMLWQQQRQVVLDSGILGVLPNSPELALRRHEPPYPLPHPHPHQHQHPHPHQHQHQHQHPLPVDPLVVKFEEESDGETPSSTPTKAEGGAGRASSPPGGPASPASQELLLLERIQAEAAAYYNYSDLPTPPVSATHVRTNLSTKYDRLSLDELAGRKPADAKNSLDFKIMSLDEIRAKKRHSAESLNAHPMPITLNLSRKRKLSSQETIIDPNNKIIKLVRSNSIVYKKLDSETKDKDARKRTVSEQSDVLELQDDELVDDCHTFKKVKVDELNNKTKPTLIRTKTRSESKVENDDSDSEVQIVCEKICYNAKRTGDIENTIEIVDLSDEEDDVILTDLELGLGRSVPDVVASCQSSGEKVMDEFDKLLAEEL